MLVARASSGRKIPRRERHRNYAHDHLGGKKTRSGFFLLQLCGIACVFNGFNELIGFDLALLDFNVCFVRQGYIRINYSFDL